MRKATLVVSLLTLLSLLAACTQEPSRGTPDPDQLISDLRYKDQINRIDNERAQRNEKTFTELVEEGKVTKTPNGTEPVVIEISKDKTEEEQVQDEENGVVDVAHDKVQVEEYFINEIDIEESPEEETINEETQQTSDVKNIDEVNVASPDAPTISRPTPKPSKKTTESDTSTPPPPKESKKTNAGSSSSSPAKPAPTETADEKTKTEQKPPIKKQEESSSETDQNTSEESPNPSLRPKERPKNLSKGISSYKARWDGNPRGQLYTQYTLNALDRYGSKLLNTTNIKDNGYCPRLNSLNKDQKKQFWLMLISGIARWESGFDPNAKYLETSGEFSRGLTQLGYTSTKSRFYKCGFKSKYELHNSQKNLSCAVKIINHLVGQNKIVRGFYWKNRKRAWLGAARYWSVLRPEIWSGQKKRDVLTIPAYTRKLSFCR